MGNPKIRRGNADDEARLDGMIAQAIQDEIDSFEPDPLSRDRILSRVRAELDKIDSEAWSGGSEARWRSGSRIRVVAFSAAAIIAAAVILIPAARQSVAKTILQVFDRVDGSKPWSVSIKTETGGKDEVVKDEHIAPEVLTIEEARARSAFRLLEPTFLPPGAILNQIQLYQLAEDQTRVALVYSLSGTDRLEIVQMNFSGDFKGDSQIDKDRFRVKSHEVSGSEGLLIEAVDGISPSTLIWVANGIKYEVRGRLEPSALTKIAESLR